MTAPASATTGADDTDAPLYRSQPLPKNRGRCAPSFSWANRGQSDMTVWIREAR